MLASTPEVDVVALTSKVASLSFAPVDVVALVARVVTTGVFFIVDVKSDSLGTDRGSVGGTSSAAVALVLFLLLFFAIGVGTKEANRN